MDKVTISSLFCSMGFGINILGVTQCKVLPNVPSNWIAKLYVFPCDSIMSISPLADQLPYWLLVSNIYMTGQIQSLLNSWAFTSIFKVKKFYCIDPCWLYGIQIVPTCMAGPKASIKLWPSAQSCRVRSLYVHIVVWDKGSHLLHNCLISCYHNNIIKLLVSFTILVISCFHLVMLKVSNSSSKISVATGNFLLIILGFLAVLIIFNIVEVYLQICNEEVKSITMTSCVTVIASVNIFAVF